MGRTPDSPSQPTFQVSRRALMRGAVLLGAGAVTAGVPVLAAGPALAQVSEPSIHGRGAWNARTPRSPVTVYNRRPNKVIVHHTASGNVSDTSLSWAFTLSRAVQNWHMDNNGWIDAGQQFTISRGGHIMEGRDRSLPTLHHGGQFVHGAHAGAQNNESIGIENEGTYTSVSPPNALWNSLVHQCAYICAQYDIPATQIYGHRDFSSTACPGNVLYSMLGQLRSEVAAMLDGGGGGFESVVDSTSARFTAGGNWSTSSWSGDSYGNYYHFADPVLASDAGWFQVDIPSSGTYQVDAWYPANSGYNDQTPFVIMTSNGSQTVHVNQRTNGGQWVNLGSFPLDAGDGNVVAVSRWTNGSGYVIADAVRVRN